ncbi:MAG TPA: hypothetical protein VH092_36225 [Urbifossiella sp.]|jgi:hypothetical protein|nr:hypothetical protein [Urbifossiella sp.]
MDESRRVIPQIEPFEDRLAPSRGGFDPGSGPGPGDDPGRGDATPAIMRDAPEGYGHAGPFVGTTPVARGPGADLVVIRSDSTITPPTGTTTTGPLAGRPAAESSSQPTAQPAAEPSAQLPAPFAAEPGGRLIVAPAIAASAGAPVAGGFHLAALLPPADAHADTGPTPAGSPAGAPPLPASVFSAAVAAGVNVLMSTSAPIAAGEESADASPGSGAGPALEPEAPRPTTLPAPAWDFAPLVVDGPAGVPLAGAFGIDLIAVEDGVRQVLDRVADLAAGPAEGWGTNGWLAAAAVLAGGAGWAGARAGRARRAPAGVYLGWGDRDDGRLG